MAKSELEKIYREELIHPDPRGDYLTDKGSYHSYIQNYYSKEFTDREGVSNILELGVMSGGSIMLWHKWFTNAIVEGVDIWEETITNFHEMAGDTAYPRAKLYILDGYVRNTVDSFEDDTYDYIIDDGPHSLASQVYCVENYLCKVKPGGKMIIEDVQDIRHIESLRNAIDPELAVEFCTFDFSKMSNRSDDIIFEITRQ
tara:strand:+ start:1463 stop:2062 length:600 start_codon:yes stop_codon:yes gene_type:complete